MGRASVAAYGGQGPGRLAYVVSFDQGWPCLEHDRALALACLHRTRRLSESIPGWAGWHWWRGSRHRVRVGMTTGYMGLVFWSFLMATAHGAGLMLLPVLLPMTGMSGGAHAQHLPAAQTAWTALAALGVHSLAMLATTGVVAMLVYEWLGVAVLRRGWVNLDLLWTVALVVTGLVLILT